MGDLACSWACKRVGGLVQGSAIAALADCVCVALRTVRSLLSAEVGEKRPR